MHSERDGILILLEEDLRGYVSDMANGLFRKAIANAYWVARHGALLIAGPAASTATYDDLNAMFAERLDLDGGPRDALLSDLAHLRDARRMAVDHGLVPVTRDEALAAGRRAEALLRAVLAAAGAGLRDTRHWPAVDAALLGLRIMVGRPHP